MTHRYITGEESKTLNVGAADGTRSPVQRSAGWTPRTRREFLRHGAVAATATATLPVLLEACGGGGKRTHKAEATPTVR
jgi:hypothetical protein